MMQVPLLLSHRRMRSIESASRCLARMALRPLIHSCRMVLILEASAGMSAIHSCPVARVGIPVGVVVTAFHPEILMPPEMYGLAPGAARIWSGDASDPVSSGRITMVSASWYLPSWRIMRRGSCNGALLMRRMSRAFRSAALREAMGCEGVPGCASLPVIDTWISIASD